MSNESREAFENWYSGRMDISASFKIDEDGYYEDSAEQIAWRGWQACEQSKQADLDQLRAELEKAVIPLIPEGCALVPIEPTDKMRHAFWRADERYENGLGEMPDSGWEWMLRAASEEPKP